METDMLATTRATTLRVVKAHYFLAAGLAALVLTAIAAAGSWQMSGDNGGAASMAPPTAVGATAEREPTHTFYLVTSQDRAATLQSALQMEVDMVADIRAGEGDFGPPDVFYVEVVNDAASLDRVMEAFLYLNKFRFDNGLPEVNLVDLRGLGR